VDGFLPIREYAVVGDGLTAALVGRDGSIDWLCWPRFDSPSAFGRLLGKRAGHFSVAIREPREVTRTYRAGTAVLETRFRSASGAATLVDAMAVTSDADGTGFRSEHALVRSLQCTDGEVEAQIVFAPRPGYGTEDPALERNGTGLVAAASSGRIVLDATTPLGITEEGAVATVPLRAGQRIDAVAGWERAPDAARAEELLRATERRWRVWTEGLRADTPFREAVIRGAITLKLLDYQPTGAIVAAPTTSLPETIGGVRNWDYRFGWIRDVAYSVYALRRAGVVKEAEIFLDWAFAAARCRPEDVRVLYPLERTGDTTERVLDGLEGYRRSAPVRVGNAAADQVQLDAFGELLDCLHLWRVGGAEITPAMWQCIRAQIDWLVTGWEQPDFGIWEVRSKPRRFTYSAAMCHVAFDRAVRAAEDLGLRAPLSRWRRERDRALEAVEGSWSDELGAFAQTVDGREVDASLLALPPRRVIPADDPRMRRTVDAIQDRLGAGHGLVYRYLTEDGLPGHEGAFLICSFWLADCLAMRGDLDRAGALAEELLGHANDVGLFAEQVHPTTREFLGNFPQGLSHIGAVATAVNLGRGRIPSHP
jgi:GH15 family glucan-1,4-alpha-glucosidase